MRSRLSWRVPGAVQEAPWKAADKQVGQVDRRIHAHGGAASTAQLDQESGWEGVELEAPHQAHGGVVGPPVAVASDQRRQALGVQTGVVLDSAAGCLCLATSVLIREALPRLLLRRLEAGRSLAGEVGGCGMGLAD